MALQVTGGPSQLFDRSVTQRAPKVIIYREPDERQIDATEALLLMASLRQLPGHQVPPSQVFADIPEVIGAARTDAYCAHLAVSTLVPTLSKKLEPPLVESCDIQSNLSCWDNVVSERLRRIQIS